MSSYAGSRFLFLNVALRLRPGLDFACGRATGSGAFLARLGLVGETGSF